MRNALSPGRVIEQDPCSKTRISMLWMAKDCQKILSFEAYSVNDLLKVDLIDALSVFCFGSLDYLINNVGFLLEELESKFTNYTVHVL
jgi:hypothetical protein